MKTQLSTASNEARSDKNDSVGSPFSFYFEGGQNFYARLFIAIMVVLQVVPNFIMTG